jgi:hypothetical protein
MDDASIESMPFKTGSPRVLARGYYGRYLPTGHLVYIRQGVLFGVKFDPEALEVHGTPVPLLEDVAANPVTGGGQFDFSNTGTMFEDRILKQFPRSHEPGTPLPPELRRLRRTPYPAQSLSIAGIARCWDLEKSARAMAECASAFR